MILGVCRDVVVPGRCEVIFRKFAVGGSLLTNVRRRRRLGQWLGCLNRASLLYGWDGRCRLWGSGRSSSFTFQLVEPLLHLIHLNPHVIELLPQLLSLLVGSVRLGDGPHWH